MIGETISHYKIVKKLAEGGRGVVYKAEDTTLDRFVALKFLPEDMKADEEKKERFIQEAKTASALDHVNICTIHEIEETEDGQIFICMPYYEGETLGEKIKAGPVKLGEVIDFSMQAAQGLDRAHQRGIVHRDIKPQNIIVTNDGVVKIVDFGLARLAGGKKLTKEGVTVGTVGYMSPEQARGDEVDQRTDIWSLGVVMYELISGRSAFKGDNAQAVIYSILNVNPEPVTYLRPKIPRELERIVNKCLAKECSLRYQDLQELIADLLILKEKLSSGAAQLKKVSDRRNAKKPSMLLVSLVIFCSVLIMVSLYFIFEKSKRVGLYKKELVTAEVKKSIAVLPFKDISPDGQQEYFCDGMVEELNTALSKIKGLHVTSRTSSFQFKGKEIDIREIGKRINVQNVLEGSVCKVGKTVRITVQLINATDGYHLWSEAFEREFEFGDVFKIQDEITDKIVGSLKIKLSMKLKSPLIKRYTENVEAYELYLKGRYFWKKRQPEDINKGIRFFRQAIEKDPDYALAHVGLADSYHLLATYNVLSPKEAFPVSEKAARRALEIDDTLGEAHNSLAAVKLYYEWDFKAAEKEFKRAIELSPNFVTARQWYAKCLAFTNRLEESLNEMKLAAEIDPLSITSLLGIARHQYFLKKYDAAIEQFGRALELNPNHFLALAQLGQTYVKKSMFKEAIDCFERANAITKRMEPAILSGLGYSYGISGQKEKALEILAEMRNLSGQRYIRPFYIAAIYIGLGDKNKAFYWLEKAYNDRCDWMIYLQVEHMFDPIREDPRFAELVRKVGLKK